MQLLLPLLLLLHSSDDGSQGRRHTHTDCMLADATRSYTTAGHLSVTCLSVAPYPDLETFTARRI